MDRSPRLTDGTRWRTFMRLLRLDDLMTSYTNAGAPELAPRGGSRPQHGLRTHRVTVPHLADVARLVQLDGSRHAPMNERQVRAVRSRRCSTLKALRLEALLVRRFCDPWSVFSPSMESFLKRTANASFVPRLLSIGPPMSASVYRGLRGCN